jgi:hypothetical protein
MSWVKPQPSGDILPNRASCSANLVEDKIFVFGGDDGKGALYNDGYYLDTATSLYRPFHLDIHSDFRCLVALAGNEDLFCSHKAFGSFL